MIHLFSELCRERDTVRPIDFLYLSVRLCRPNNVNAYRFDHNECVALRCLAASTHLVRPNLNSDDRFLLVC